MSGKVLVAGATGNLGRKIVKALLARGADVRAVIRPQTDREKREKLTGVEVVDADFNDPETLRNACGGVAVVVSALQGLREVIVDAQTNLLNAAVAAGVPRFIPSDFAADFTKVAQGQNRNFDLRKEFKDRLDAAAIGATSILNGAFADLLVYTPMFIDFEKHQVGYWETSDQPMDFTTMDDTAAYTAAAALDDSTPRILNVAGSVVTPKRLAEKAQEVTKTPFELVRLGSLEELTTLIDKTRAEHPEGEREEYPLWQSLQYVRDMASGAAKLDRLDNDRYPELKWTDVRDVIASRRS